MPWRVLLSSDQDNHELSIMEDTAVNVAGELSPWPAKDYLAGVLRSAGLNIYVGQYSIRVEDCSHFFFENYGGDICEPTIDADAGSVEEMTRDAKLVSDALSRAAVKHRFELYDVDNKMVDYLHYDWPLGHDG